jgi:ATP-binding cassette subfamily F protein 3
MLNTHQISKTYSLNPVLLDVTFSVNPGERVGLIGPNGCGKTTLFRILAGEETPDYGVVNFSPSNLRLGYLPQGFEPPAEVTIKALIQQITADPETLEPELTRLAMALAENPGQPDLQSAYDTILRKMEQPSAIGQLSSTLAGLGLDQLPDEQLVSTLSGGQKTRLSLALVLLSDPQILLLDEPTNHLDIEMLEWLEDWLNQFRGAALIISHDRTFLERTVTRILDLNPESHTIRSYEGSYSDYIEQNLRERHKQWEQYRDQVTEIRRMKQDIVRLKEHARKIEITTTSREPGTRVFAKKAAKKAKSREKKLDRYTESEERVEKPKAGWQLKLEFEETARLGKQVLNLEDLSVGYPGYEPLLSNINLNVQAGQRIAFTGANGSGKTTLLRVIAGQLPPLGGRATLGSSVKLGYMSQEQEVLDPRKNAVETIQSVASYNQTDTRNFLHYYLFSGDDPLRPIEQLSYGERARLMLARLVAQGCNFLLLDEPTNHLDISSRELFEQALNGFEGTVLAVVHDRYFIQRFASEVWKIDHGEIRRRVNTVS